MNFNYTKNSFPNPLPISNKKLQNNLDSQFILPRRGWQDKQAYARTLAKTKRALELAEIEHLIYRL